MGIKTFVALYQHEVAAVFQKRLYTESDIEMGFKCLIATLLSCQKDAFRAYQPWSGIKLDFETAVDQWTN